MAQWLARQAVTQRTQVQIPPRAQVVSFIVSHMMKYGYESLAFGHANIWPCALSIERKEVGALLNACA